MKKIEEKLVEKVELYFSTKMARNTNWHSAAARRIAAELAVSAIAEEYEKVEKRKRKKRENFSNRCKRCSWNKASKLSGKKGSRCFRCRPISRR